MHTFYLFQIPLLQKTQGLEILGMKQQSVALFIDIFDGCEHFVLERLIEVYGI